MTDRNKSVISKKGTSGLEPLKTTYMTITFDRLQICAIFLHPWMRLINTIRLVPISMSHSFWFKSYDCSNKRRLGQIFVYKAFLEKILEMVGPVFSEFNLIVNVDKTEWTIIAHKDMLEFASSWEGTRKLGSLLGVEEDVSRRIQLATVSFQSLEVIWKHRSLVPTATRIRSYQALVESVLMYNCGTWGLTEAIADKIDRFQRKLLRRVARVMGISWSDRVTNEALYEESGITRASEQAIDARWRLFGHALRMHEDSPARQAMAYYFVNDQKGRQGNRTTIASALSDDYKAAFGKTIKTKEEYESMITLASNRNYWKEEIVAKVVSEYKKCKKDKYDRQKEKRKAKGKGKGGKK